MVKMKEILHPLRQVLDEKGNTIRCPKCRYDCHRVMGAGNTDKGINPRNLELECGRCKTMFYEFLAN